jgi:mRNA-degrading endonuclease RelE of RelBE toxin-antitoxin system
MTYDIIYREPSLEASSELTTEEQNRVFAKLSKIATSETREPWDWDYKNLKDHRQLDGRFRIGDLRVLITLHKDKDMIEIHSIVQRKNGY